MTVPDVPTPVHVLFTDLLGRMFLAAALGAVIGLERELRQKEAGLRTNILITMGSALFTILSIEIPGPTGDPGRIAAQIVTGIGFLGGGAILHTKGTIQGLTTAATIWMNAATGVAAGAGRYSLAIVATATTLLTLVLLVPVERWLNDRRG
ncbi:MAG TPA: MgtC/SapB family protein [Vicinamibacterales bacterium]|nr:MgtC/SapB family protein [Vicinamibacterales bacterium]